MRLPTGQEWTEQADFRSDGTCYFGHPPDYVADCKWTRNGRIITISRNDVVLAELKFDGKNLVLAEDDTFHSPFVPQD